MVDFRQSRRPRNYLSRREQWRLLLLVVALGLVILLINEARKPENWPWFRAEEAGEDGVQAAPDSRQKAPFDNRAKAKSSKKEASGAPIPPPPFEAEEDTTGRYFPGVKPDYLKLVQDNIKFRNQERYAWFNLLDVLNKNDQATLEQESTGRVFYAQLFDQSNEYRGELVTIRGTVRRACPCWPAPPNDCGIEGYYRLWCFPADNPPSPIVVYCLYLPEGFPTGLEVVAEAEITGFYFKRWLHKAWNPEREQNTVRLAPTLAARTVRWEKPPAPAKKAPADVGSILLMIGAALAIGLLVALYVYTRTRPVRADKPSAPPDFDALRDFTPPLSD